MGSYTDEPRPMNAAADAPAARIDERTPLVGSGFQGGHSRASSLLGSAFNASTIASISGGKSDGHKRACCDLARHAQRSSSSLRWAESLTSAHSAQQARSDGSPRFSSDRATTSRSCARLFARSADHSEHGWYGQRPYSLLTTQPGYDWTLFAGDLTSGITLACLLIPQALSYASTLAHLPAINGLFGVIAPSFVYALLGTCPQLSVGPEAALSLMTGQAVAEVLADLPEGTSAADRIAIATNVTTAVTFLAGLITLLLGLLRLGFLDAVLSRPLLRGFVTAVGAVIAVSQSIILLGLQQRAADEDLQSTIDKARCRVRYCN